MGEKVLIGQEEGKTAFREAKSLPPLASVSTRVS